MSRRAPRGWIVRGLIVWLCACGGKVVFVDDDDGAGGENASLGGGSVNPTTSNGFSTTGNFGGQTTSSSASSGGSGSCQVSGNDGPGTCFSEGSCLGQPVSVSCVVIPEEIGCTCTVGGDSVDLDCTLFPSENVCSLDMGCCAQLFLSPQ